MIPRSTSIQPEQITAVINKYLPGRSIKSVTDRGIWIRHSFRIELDNDETVWLKADDGPEAEGCSEKEAFICNLLNTNGLPAPCVLALDTSCGLLPAPFIIQEHVSGRPLSTILREISTHEALALFAELGAFFSRLHSIHNDRSGWIYGSGSILPYHPNDFMLGICRESTAIS